MGDSLSMVSYCRAISLYNRHLPPFIQQQCRQTMKFKITFTLCLSRLTSCVPSPNLTLIYCKHSHTDNNDCSIHHSRVAPTLHDTRWKSCLVYQSTQIASNRWLSGITLGVQLMTDLTRRMAIANGTCVSFCTFWPPLSTPLGQSR